MSYFDAALLAPAVKCPTVVGLGLVDRLQSRVGVMTFSESHTDGAAMRAWDRFDAIAGSCWRSAAFRPGRWSAALGADRDVTWPADER